jgi:hypothetical protein
MPGSDGSCRAVREAMALGIPVSTTHIICTSIMGVGSTMGISTVKWGVARTIMWAWILTRTDPAPEALSRLAALWEQEWKKDLFERALDKVREKMVDEKVTIYDDGLDPQGLQVPFDFFRAAYDGQGFFFRIKGLAGIIF